MWGDLGRLLGSVITPSGSIAALCETRALFQDTTEYYTTRKLVMEHLWIREGGQ